MSEVWYLCSKRVCDLYAVVVSGSFAYEIGNVGRLGRAWLIFETLKVGLDIVPINFDLDLAWESNVEASVMPKGRCGSTVDHESQVRIQLRSFTDSLTKADRHTNGMPIALHF